MKRQILGVLAASLAAPYLAVAFMFALPAWEEAAKAGILEALGKLFFWIVLAGTFALIVYGIPILIMATLIAFTLSKLRATSRWIAMAAGSVNGLALGSLAIVLDDGGDWSSLPAFILAGALCGLLYWRIALGGQARAPVV